MENKNTSVGKNAINYGAILGIVLIMYSLILYMLDMITNQALAYVSYIFMLGGVIIGIKNYRDKVLGGYISYGKGLGFGTLVCLFAGILSAIYTYVLYDIIDPELIDKMIAIGQEKMIEQGLSQEQIAQAEPFQRKFMHPGIMAGMVIFMTTLIGFVMSLIVAAVLKKEGEPEFE